MLKKLRLKNDRKLKFVAIISLFVIAAISISYIIPFFQGQKAKTVVKRFYQLEQAGNYGESWGLFHPLMQNKFTKDTYIQRRAHVFMQDFGVSTFSFEIGHPKEVSNWRMTKETPGFPKAYEIPVTQHFKSTFGIFTIHQEVYAVNDNDQWRILWQYDE